MANRGYPVPGDDGKPAGFPTQQAVNGGYGNMYYPSQEMMMPYGSYGMSPHMAGFRERPLPQAVNDQQRYGYDTNPYLQQYQQHHAMVNYASHAAAYHQAQQSRLPNPQQIADSIYNMASHAYQNSYQAPAGHQVPYSSPQAAALSVHTGHSPAGSMHSPSGSTHSLGDRPMLSPHLQSSGASMYYNQTNQLSPMNQMNQSHPHYYSSNGHNITRDMEHRAHMEMPAPMASPPTTAEKTSKPRRTSSSSSRKQSTQKQAFRAASSSKAKQDESASQHLQSDINAAVARLEPLKECSPSVPSLETTCEPANSQPLSETANSQPPRVTETISATPESCDSNREDSKIMDTVDSSSAVVSTSSIIPVPTTTAVTTTMVCTVASASSIPAITTCSSVPISSANLPCVRSIPDGAEVKPTDSEATLPPFVSVPEPKSHESISEQADQHSAVVTDKVDADPQPPSVPPEPARVTTGSNKVSKPDVHSLKKSEKLQSKKDSKAKVSGSKRQPSKVPSESHDNKDSLLITKESQSDSIQRGEPDTSIEEAASSAQTGSEEKKVVESDDTSVNLPTVGSPSAEPVNSLSSSSASKASLGDESRLPPRKRKQQLSEHTVTSPQTPSLQQQIQLPSSLPLADLALAFMPPKKRGRPSKEMVKLREAAKLLEAQQMLELQQLQQQKQQQLQPPVTSGSKERKPSGSSKKEKEKSAKHDKESIDKVKSAVDKTTSRDVVASPINTPETEALAKDNAVLVSPPKKPKASVAEMQKALMKVVSSSTPDGMISGKRRRGRPLGSKNKKTLMTEHRARSGSSSSKKDSSSLAMKAGSDMSSASSSSKTINVASLQVPGVGSHLTHVKSPSLSPHSLTKSDFTLPTSYSSWACVFCNQISNYRDLGDLFGGYIVQPNTPVAARLLSHKQLQKARASSVSSETGLPNTEVWFHERCLVWAPGVYMLTGKLYGLYEAVHMACSTRCTECKQNGAVVGCYHKGCKNRYHVHCADNSGCLLIEENFSMLCPVHKDKKLVLV